MKRQEFMERLSGMYRDDILMNIDWHLAQCEGRIKAAEASRDRQVEMARDVGDRARAWWDHCVAEKQRGRKTVRMEGWV